MNLSSFKKKPILDGFEYSCDWDDFLIEVKGDHYKYYSIYIGNEEINFGEAVTDEEALESAVADLKLHYILKLGRIQQECDA